MQQALNVLCLKQTYGLRHRVMGFYLLLIVYTGCVWLWAYYAFHSNPLLLSTALLAYSFGLRHAIDPDHIAAIDNVTRKLMQEGKQPLSLGFFFSLGHSTVVFIATIVVSLTTSALLQNDLLRTISAFCSNISALFLLFIGIANLFIFRSVWKKIRAIHQGKIHFEAEMEIFKQSGFVVRYLQTFLRLVDKSWHMYFVGFLFGIGFDTATEIALLAITASQTIDGISMPMLLIFPALFTAGMTLLDTTDCILMLYLYGWAFLKPMRKLYYNLTMIFISVIIALFISMSEVLGSVIDAFHVKGFAFELIKSINAYINESGYYIILFFIICWFSSFLTHRYMNARRLQVHH